MKILNHSSRIYDLQRIIENKDQFFFPIIVYKEHSGACSGAENDIGSSSGLTLLACQQKCDATQGCGAVSWAFNDCHMTSDMANTIGDGSYWTCFRKGLN